MVYMLQLIDITFRIQHLVVSHSQDEEHRLLFHVHSPSPMRRARFLCQVSPPRESIDS